MSRTSLAVGESLRWPRVRIPPCGASSERSHPGRRFQGGDWLLRAGGSSCRPVRTKSEEYGSPSRRLRRAAPVPDYPGHHANQPPLFWARLERTARASLDHVETSRSPEQPSRRSRSGEGTLHGLRIPLISKISSTSPIFTTSLSLKYR